MILDKPQLRMPEMVQYRKNWMDHQNDRHATLMGGAPVISLRLSLQKYLITGFAFVMVDEHDEQSVLS